MASPGATLAPPGFVDNLAKSEYLRLALSCFLVSFASAHTSLLAIVFQRDGYDLHTIGLLLSLIAIPIIAFSLLSGEAMARLGALGTLRLAMALILIGFGSLAETRASFWPALGSRLVQGVGQGLFLASAYTYVQSRIDATRFLFLLGVFSATMPLAQAIAPPFGGYVLQRWGETFFFVTAVVPGVVGLLVTFGLRPVPRPANTGRLQLIAGWRPGAWEPLMAVLMNGALFGFCIAYLAVALVASGVPLAAFFTSSLVTMFASRLLALRGIERADRRLLVGGGLGLMSVGLAAVAANRFGAAPVVAGGIAFGLGYSLTYPVIAAWISEGADARDRAGQQALLNGAFNIGLFAMPLPETLLIGWLGYDGTMLSLAAAGVAMAAFLTARGLRRRHFEGRDVHKPEVYGRDVHGRFN